jgi:hypothetical protein
MSQTKLNFTNYLDSQGHIRRPCLLDIVATIYNMQRRMNAQMDDTELTKL